MKEENIFLFIIFGIFLVTAIIGLISVYKDDKRRKEED